MRMRKNRRRMGMDSEAAGSQHLPGESDAAKRRRLALDDVPLSLRQHVRARSLLAIADRPSAAQALTPEEEPPKRKRKLLYDVPRQLHQAAANRVSHLGSVLPPLPLAVVEHPEKRRDTYLHRARGAEFWRALPLCLESGTPQRVVSSTFSAEGYANTQASEAAVYLQDLLAEALASSTPRRRRQG